MPTGQSRTELAERVGFECAAIALIPLDYGAPGQASYRHYFRHGERTTIERMTQHVALRGLRVYPPPAIRRMNDVFPLTCKA